MPKRHNYGTANNLGIIGAALIGNFFGLFLFICFLVWLPWWVYAIIVTAIVTYFLLKTKPVKETTENKSLQQGGNK